MHIVHVFIHVKEESKEDFKQATLENVRNSRLETGVILFDFVQQQDDNAKFLLMEEYYSLEDQLAHRETEHYKKWKSATADMLTGEYTRKLYHRIEDQTSL